MVLCTFFTAIGQIFFKFSTFSLSLSIKGILSNYWLIVGLFFYFIGALLLVIALKQGELSIVYPLVSLSFVWITLIMPLVSNEIITIQKLSGVSVIFFGVILLGRGSKK